MENKFLKSNEMSNLLMLKLLSFNRFNARRIVNLRKETVCCENHVAWNPDSPGLSIAPAFRQITMVFQLSL